jgi:hypothetical protein
MRNRSLGLACVWVLALSALAWAQSVSGTLSGRVASVGGAGIPNAAVTITNVGTNASQKVLTAADGTFSVVGLAPGTYRIDVENAGYKRTSQQNIELPASGPANVNIVMEAGSANESVEIRGTSPQVQGNGAEISTGIGTRMIRELPLIDRNHQELVGLQTGITPPQPAIDMVRDPARNRFYSANGQSPTVNEWQSDGVWNQEPFRGTATRVQPVENLQELQITTSAHTAEKGFVGGALVNTVTRGGTNDWHGSLFEFYSGNEFRTRNPLNSGTIADPRFVYNQFGATAGGPVVKDKTFVFGSYEGTYQNGATTQITTVPLPQVLTGNFAGIPGLVLYNPRSGINGAQRTPFGGDLIPISQFNSSALAIARDIPAPNLPGLTNNYITNVPSRNHGNKADGRVDQHFSDRTSAFLRYGFTNYWTLEGSPLGAVIGAGTRDRLLAQNVVADVAHEVTSSLITDFRFGYNRYDQKLNPAGDATSLGAFGTLASINISGLSPIGAPGYLPQNGVDNTFNWVWSWSYHRSMHDIKFGVDVRRIRSDGFQDAAYGSLFGANGTAFFGPGATLTANGTALGANSVLYNSLAAFLVGAPSQVGNTSYFTNPTIRQTEYSAWVGDTLHLTRRLTLDIGVRYEVYSPLEPAHTGGAAFFNASNNTFNYAGVNGTSMHYNDYDVNNVAPRVGMAARITDRTVFRAGYGINYFQQPYMFSGFTAPLTGFVSGVQGGYSTTSVPFSTTIANTAGTPGPLVNGASAGNLPAAVSPATTVTPYVQTFDAQIQQDFKQGFVLTLGYVGALGRHLPYVEELNAARPGTGTAGLPFSSLGRTGSTLAFYNGLTSNYNSLQTSLNKSFSGGLSFMASYTWSRAMGYTTGNNMLLNRFDLRSNYGPLDYDRQHMLSISHVWELPLGRNGNSIVKSALGGWQLNGIFTWATGTPLTATSDPLLCACPGNTVLANLNGSAYAQNSGLQYLNAASFSSPAAGQFGTLGRGALRAEGFKNYDMSLFKNFRVRDRMKLELRGEVFNLTNTPRFANPVTNVNSPSFGQSVGLANGSSGRQFNIGVRALF